MRTWLLRCMAILTLVALAGCNAGPGASIETEIPVVKQDTAGSILAEGRVEPARSVTLRAANSSQVVEVLVEEGDTIEEGAILLRLDPADAEMAIQQAEAGLALAQAQLALARAGARPEQIAIIEAQLAAAEAALAQAEAQRDEQTAGMVDAGIADAQAQLAAAASAYRQANEAHDKTMECFDVTFPDGSENHICPALGPYEEVTRFQMEAAYAALLAAQAQLDALQSTAGPQIAAAQAAVQSATARRDAVQAQLELAQAGSRAEEIALAEAGVQHVQTALAQARALLELSVIEAPFDGTVTELPVDVGDTAAQGAPLVTLATTEHLQVKTVDLTEVDAVQVQVGQPAIVVADAAAGQLLAGRVVRVDRQGINYLGDVTYPAVIGLNDTHPPWLRWGMTVQVQIGESGSQLPNQPTNQPTGQPIIAEAVIEPARWSGLQLVASGEVAQVQVSAGDQVTAGDLLVQLDPTHTALAVQEAEAALASAQAQLALAKAGPRLEEIAAAEAALAGAQSDLQQATALRDQLAAGVAEAELAGVQAQLEAAKAEEHQAQLVADQVNTEGDEDAKITANEQLQAAHLKVAAAEARLAALPRASAAQLRAAEAGVQAAQAQVDAAQAELDLLRAGPTQEEIAVAEAQVQQAEAALAEAQVALDRTALRAPFAGTVTQVHVEVGDTAGPGQPVLVLAALDHLQVTTTDLTELDVVRVTGGQSVTVSVDALPERSFQGHVARIGLQGVDFRGDVTYPATIELDEAVAELLWGMTAVVEIAAP